MSEGRYIYSNYMIVTFDLGDKKSPSNFPPEISDSLFYKGKLRSCLVKFYFLKAIIKSSVRCTVFAIFTFLHMFMIVTLKKPLQRKTGVYHLTIPKIESQCGR
ncbi:hypothetical protein HELRODRAFT_170404 [Helobdella robusta]|uniref:Uncharacterized protein n=1 Tax=Helobdella robusta TaxID=6412 RepID=T1F307_HELRO|nr:hypothetical protein HELRODRAFT_170404 [Helobdella robusta]ESO07105.1 hypothetical protein HELRODRAFT_170404 [Helobdella robusta]